MCPTSRAYKRLLLCSRSLACMSEGSFLYCARICSGMQEVQPPCISSMARTDKHTKFRAHRTFLMSSSALSGHLCNGLSSSCFGTMHQASGKSAGKAFWCKMTFRFMMSAMYAHGIGYARKAVPSSPSMGKPLHHHMQLMVPDLHTCSPFC